MGTSHRFRSLVLCSVIAGAPLVFGGGCGSKATEGMQPGECTDGLDNDENGLLDCFDPGCEASPDCKAVDTGASSDDTGPEPADTGTPDPDPGPGADWPASITWLEVPAGDFLMGAVEEEELQDDDEFSRTITHTYDYEIAATEVTVGLYAQATGTETDASCGDTCPVVGLSWHESARVTVLLSEAAGLDPCYSCTGAGEEAYCVPLGQPMWCSGYRLPTEAEWERAARADAETIYAGSNSVDEVAWVASSSGGVAHPVSELAANAWGGFDFSGNAWEWCHDLWVDMPDAIDAVDPTGGTTGEFRVIRGGAFDGDGILARAANRDPLDPASRWDSSGLRLARTLNP